MSYKFQKGDAKLGGAIEASQLTGALKPSSLADATTDDIAEGSAQYYTDARARGAVSITDAGGDGSMAYDSGTGVFTYTGPSASEVRAHFSGAAGIDLDNGNIAVNVDDSSIELPGDVLQVKALGITNAMLSGGIASAKLAELNAFDTDALSEGANNQYFTSDRARKSVSVVDAGGDGSLTYVSGTGVFTYTGPSASEVRAHFSGAAGIDLSSGAIAVNVDDSSLEISGDALQVKALGITRAMLEADAVDGSKLADDAVDSEHIAAGAIDFEHFAASSVSGSALADAGIANAKLVNDAVTLTAGAGMGTLGAVALGSSITVAVDGVLEDLDTLGAATADGEFIVATGAGAFAYESGDTARTSLGLGTGDTPSFSEVSASNGFATNGLIQAGTVQASTYNGDSVAVTGITGSLNNKLGHGDGIAPFSFNNGSSVQVSLSSSVAGEGLAYSPGVLSLDFSELTDAELDVTADFLVYMDAGGNSRREDAGHFVANIAGDGLTESSGQLVVGVDDSSIERSGDAVQVKALGITNAMLSGGIADSKLNTISTADKVAGSAVQLKSDGGLVNDSGLALSSSVAGEGLKLTSGVLSVVHTVTDAGNGDFDVAYGVNFQSSNMTGPVTASLPAVASGDEGKTVIIKVRNADQQTVRVQADGSQNIDGSGDDLLIESGGGAVTLVALSAAAGWAIV